MSEKAVIDRFEGNMAVLFVGEAQTLMSVLRSILPKDAKEGTWLVIELQDEQIIKAEIDAKTTKQKLETIAEKLTKLRRGDHLK